MTSSFEALTQINLDDLVASFGWQDRPLLTRSLRNLFLKPAQNFARHVVEYDEVVGLHGIVEGGWNLLQRYVKDFRIINADCIPDSPFLALSNHPGMSDTLALFCALNRPDLKIIALDRPFLNSLPNTSKHLFYLKDDVASRVNLVRQVTSHLRNGGAALTFPAGHIEPDPDVHEGALDSLQTWTDSAGVFIRMAPETAVLPVLVRSVVWDKAPGHFLLGIKKTKEEKEKLAAAFQLLAHVAFKKKDVHVRVQIGKPIYAKDLGTTETAVIHQAVLVEMKRLIENPSQGEGMSVM